VKMVGHQAISEQAHAGKFTCLAQKFDEGGKIALLAEDSLAAIAPIEDLVAETALGSPCMSRHAAIMTSRLVVGKG